MLKKVILLLLMLPVVANAQSYTETIKDWQEGYKQSLLNGTHPLKPQDTPYVKFYNPDERYHVTATFVPITGTKPFLMENRHGDARIAVKEYGYVYINLMGGSITLTIYRFLKSGGLFIPFTDRTNYKETFPGGRYLDVDIDSIRDNRVVLDFNKAYNPHTAYEKGYPYMVPPARNSLRIKIDAGEKIFGRNPGY